MLILQLFNNPKMILFLLAGLLIVITLHEFSHALVAYSLGDPTPKYQRRLSLNPFRHLDPIGSLALLLVGFGWGKPVMYNPKYLKHDKYDEFLVAMAGPLSSLLVAFIFAIPYRLTVNYGITIFEGTSFYDFCNIVTEIAVLIAAFNILPIPPLDGSKILYLFIPDNWKYWLERVGAPILMVIIFISLFTNLNFLINLITTVASWLGYLVRVFPAGLG